LQFERDFLHFEEWQDTLRRYCISETANLLNKENKTERGRKYECRSKGNIFSKYISLINITEGLYVRVYSEMKQTESRTVIHVFSQVIFFFFSEFKLISWELQVLKLAHLHTGLQFAVYLQYNWYVYTPLELLCFPSIYMRFSSLFTI